MLLRRRRADHGRCPVSRGAVVRTPARRRPTVLALVVRALERLEKLYAIGGGPGANRIGYSPEEDEAHALTRVWLEEAGLEVARRRGRQPLRALGQGRPGVWTGSHLDTVPQGGKFDGALGVVAAIEAVERTRPRHGRRLPRRGARLRREPGARRERRAARRLPRAAHRARARGSRTQARRSGSSPAIVGYARGEVVVEGRAGHAGTTPMAMRDDALVKAAERCCAPRRGGGHRGAVPRSAGSRPSRAAST